MNKKERVTFRRSKKDEEPQEAPRKPAIEQVVDGGPLKRIVFEDDDGEPMFSRVEAAPEPEPEPEPTPEPEPEPTPEPEPARTFTPVRPVNRAGIDQIHREVDALNRTTYWGTTPTETTRRPETHTLYKTRGGAVRSAEFKGSEGKKEVLYISRGNSALTEDERFVSSMVDKVISKHPNAGARAASASSTTTTTRREAMRAAPPAFSAPPVRRTVETTSSKSVTTNGVTKTTTTHTKSVNGATTKSTKSSKKAATPSKRKPKTKLYYDYKGLSYDVEELEGIGPKFGEKLRAAGVHTTGRLCYENAARLAKKLDTHTKTVRSWQAMAQLVKVSGVGPQYAEALARAGLNGIEDLKSMDAEEVATVVNSYLEGLETNVLGTGITAKRVQGWKDAAKPMRKVRQSIPEN